MANVHLREQVVGDAQCGTNHIFEPGILSVICSDNFWDYTKTTHCINCFSNLVNEYILCETCNVNICCMCFSNGEEFMNHKNNHDYRILTTNFILFDNSDWTAQEELILLHSVANYGNWNFHTQQVSSRGRTEIMDHYNYFYLQENTSKYLPSIKTRTVPIFSQIAVPYRFLLTDSDDPPRYCSNTVGYQSLAGYNPARSEFESEYDKNAEDLLSNMEIVNEDDPHYTVLSNLQYSLIESYNRRLRERVRWKNVISQHGLLLLRKVISSLHRYDLTITRTVYEKMVRFIQFCKPAKFEMILEGLHRFGELKLQISRLIYLRKNGITTLAGGRLYLHLHSIHEKNKKSLKLFRYNAEYSWRNNKSSSIIFPKLSNRRSIFVPLEILGMPGYEKLTNNERDLCRNIRLVPIAYMELKEILVMEYKKVGYVKLQTARRLLKIDVNKTRKMYDFLVQEGYIAKPK